MLFSFHKIWRYKTQYPRKEANRFGVVSSAGPKLLGSS